MRIHLARMEGRHCTVHEQSIFLVQPLLENERNGIFIAQAIATRKLYRFDRTSDGIVTVRRIVRYHSCAYAAFSSSWRVVHHSRRLPQHGYGDGGP